MTKLYIVILFNLYAEYIIRNARMDEWEGGLKYARNITALRYAKHTTLMAECKEELKSLSCWWWWKRRVTDKACLKLNIQKTKIMASSPIILLQIEGEKVETVTDFIFLGSNITVD